MSGAPAIELRDVEFAWGNDAPILAIRAFDVPARERVLIRGPSGSGKSTLLGLIGGVLQPATGSVRVLGQDLGQLRAWQRDAFRARHVGFIFQMFNLIPYLSVIDNVLLSTRFSVARRARAGDHAARAEAQRLLNALGLATSDIIERSVTQLSIGQQQRVAAARALIGRPDLLVADEPTSALDMDARLAFLDLLMQECTSAGTTLLFVSHDATLAPRFDRSVALQDINSPARGATH
jgi:putative ABC transport system ATP-binding protein